MDLENLHNSHLPSELDIQEIANQLFKSLPNQQVANESFSNERDYHANVDKVKSNLTEGSILSPQELPASVAGSGISPSIGQDQQFSIDDPQTSLPDPHFYEGKIPSSVAGSGKSPSLQNGNNNESFSLDNPQTSLHDPHFYNGQIPSSVAGSGKSPSFENFQAEGNQGIQSPNFNPFGSTSHVFIPNNQGLENTFEKELSEALNGYSTYVPHNQLGNATFGGTTSPMYYFLSEGFNQAGKSVIPFSSNDRVNTHGVTSLFKPPFDLNIVRADFPILSEIVNGKKLIWLDNAATTQKPNQVIDRISYFYKHENSNIHRAAHELAARSTDAYEAARIKVQHFINAKSVNEVVFVRGTTEAINLVAQSWGDQNLNSGDEIIVSHLEHHANIVPWQILAQKKGLIIKVIPVDDDGQLLLDEYAKLLSSRTKLVAFTQVSNALGTVTPAKKIIEMAHNAGARVLLDGAQSVSHIRTDVQDLNPDWFVFSGHKIFAPTGIGVLYGKEDLLNATQPWQGGGNMISDVTFENTSYHPAPTKFEAGTGNIADAVGLGAALDYVSKLGIDFIYQYEHALLLYATGLLKDVPGLRLIGTAKDKTSVLSFVLDGYTNDEVGKELNKHGIAVRTGHHCAQPILRRFGLESTVRPSIAFYNTCGEIDTLVSVLHDLKKGKNFYFNH
jgi:cysteine desulfurase/selenocysteine lyase